jgi:hypothetical protein
LFHGLVSWPVFSVTHGIVREYVDNRQFHQGGKTDGGPGIIAEDEKRTGKRTKLGQRQSVHNGAHGMFADAEV